MTDALLSWLGLKKAATIAGFIGAVVSLQFIEGIAGWSWAKRASAVAAGALVAAYSTPLTLEIFELSPKTEGAIAFLGGLFGMSIAGAAIKAMPDFIEAARTRFSR